MLKHIEQHCSTTHEGLNVRNILPITKVSWKLCIQLFNELTLSTNPLDKRFCFCHTTLVDYDLVQRYQNSVKEVIFITWKFLQTYNYIELIELAKLNIFCTSRNPDKFQKILTSRRRRPDFGLQRRRFESLKRRFKNQKRRFCFACLKNQ